METVNHPKHYNQGASPISQDALLELGVKSSEFQLECIVVLEKHRYGFHLGNAVKYLWRCGEKGSQQEDLKKALWYLERYVYWYSTRFWFLRTIFPGYFKGVQAAIDKIVQSLESQS